MKYKPSFRDGDCWDDILAELALTIEKVTKEQNILVKQLGTHKSLEVIGAYDQLYSLVTLQLKLIQDFKVLERVLSLNHSIYTICQN